MKIFKILDNRLLIFLFFFVFATTSYSHENDYKEKKIYLACECIKGTITIGGKKDANASGDCYDKTTTLIVDLEKHTLVNLDWYEDYKEIYIDPYDIQVFNKVEYKDGKNKLAYRTTSYYLNNYTGKLKITYDVRKEELSEWSFTEYLLKCTPSTRLF